MAGGGGGGEAEASGGKKTIFGEAAFGSVDLNLTALMDILSNLLFFLLASFGATIVMAINTSVPVQSADKSDMADTRQSVTLNIKLTKAGFEVAAMGTAQSPEELAAWKRTLPAKDNVLPYAELSKHLLAVKAKYPRSDTVILTPEPGVSYELMVQTMDAARETEIRTNGQLRPVKLFPSVVISTVVK